MLSKGPFRYAGAAIFAMTLAVAAGAQAQCLTYGPMITVSGTLERERFPGPPAYQSIAEGDEPETVWLLKLDTPECVAADPTDASGINGAVRSVKAIQLLLTDEQYKLYAGWVGGHAVLKGRLLGAMTQHHHTPVVLDTKEFGR